ncbi:MAG: NAD(P)-binding protein [Sphingomonadales bacterium]|nr:NAD(P)-binding protein [Sphingomonadales bacterium]
MPADLTRRGALAIGVGAAAAAGLPGCAARSLPGTLAGADFTRGHRLRNMTFPPVTGPVEDVGLVIAGGGVAGLATGWRLAEAGFSDFRLLELEDSTGGNARFGRNAISAYPLGAHYLPVPNREAGALRRMLAQFGMIVGEGVGGAPVYDPYQLCADLEERLFWRGQWQEGLYPVAGLTAKDKADRDAFSAAMTRFSAAMGRDGKPAFALPMAYSSADPAFTALDAISFTAWLDSQHLSSPVLRAYLRYCMRDDYGTEPQHVSAWAGIHYFAARRGWAANGDGDRELTWPEGNGRLVTLMAQRIAPHVTPARTVFRVARDGDHVLVDSYDMAANRSTRLRARAAVLAMPHFVAARVAPELGTTTGFSYAPWVVANVSVSRRPSGRGVQLAWDNVSTATDSLGYVVATHQTSGAGDGPSVLTWYMPLSNMEPAQARKAMLTRPLGEWQRIVADDLIAMNPELEGTIERIDLWRWGHAMIRPTPGYITGTPRRAALAVPPPLFLAHSDLSGLSLFEEAHYRGVLAAEGALRHLGKAFESYL